MKVSIEYEYDFVQTDKILKIVREFEDNLKVLDKNYVCRNFQISSTEKYVRD